MQTATIKRKQDLYNTQLDYVKVLLEDDKKNEAIQHLDIILNRLKKNIKSNENTEIDN